MHSFAIDVKGGEGRRILPSITKGEIVGHRLSLMSIWQYSRGGDRAYRSREDQKEPEEPNRRSHIYQSKRSHIRGEPEQEEPPEELSEHIRARGAISLCVVHSCKESLCSKTLT